MEKSSPVAPHAELSHNIEMGGCGGYGPTGCCAVRKCTNIQSHKFTGELFSINRILDGILSSFMGSPNDASCRVVMLYVFFLVCFLFLSLFVFLVLRLSACGSPFAILLEHGLLLAARVCCNGSTAVPRPVRQRHFDGAGLRDFGGGGKWS